ncbi:methyltransferase [Dongia deserti]|uniref:methyltransferase n=1 Tax=Dongia deserti TaxID=2268030 RepID=UPI000E64C802|nr:methyltransferase [Dongia deserti]
MSSETPQSLNAPELVERFQSILTGSWKTQALHVAAELRLADLLAAGPRTSADLALSVKAHPHSLHRLLRALSALDICAERADGSFELTPLGALLRDDSPHSLRAWTLWWGHHLWPVWGNLLYSVRTGKSARKHLFGTDGFEHLQNNPEAAAIFYRVTIELTRLTAQFVMQAYDFSGLKRVVDVGGGHGEMLAYVLRANPEASGILFDLAIAVEGAAGNFKKNHPDLDGRCAFVPGDFFESVPAEADAYILKSVIHDWDDERSARILVNCRRAMAEGARLLVIEPVLSERSAAISLQSTLSQHDLTMLVALGAQERTEGEFSGLLKDAGLQVSRIIPAGPVYSIIECLPN